MQAATERLPPKPEWQVCQNTNLKDAKSVPEWMHSWGTKVTPWPNFLAHARVGFSANSLATKRWGADAPQLVSLKQLIQPTTAIPQLTEDRTNTSVWPLESALVTSFGPWNKAFLFDHFPKECELTFVVGDDEEEKEEDDDDSQTKESYTSTTKVRAVDWCLHPLHDALFCDLCEAEIRAGQPFLHCWKCDIDLCKDCMDVKDVLAFRNKDLHHQPHNHYVERGHKITSSTCSCERKRKVTSVLAPLCGSGYSIMHIKLMLLLYGPKLRLIISSFNVDEDKEWGVMTDVFWVQDFARHDSDSVPMLGDAECQFFNRLTHIIKALGCDEWAARLASLRLDLSHLDPGTFLVATIPNEFRPGCGNTSEWCGMPYVRSVLEQQHPCGPIELSPAFVTAFSVGRAQKPWQKAMAEALGVSLDSSLRIVSHTGTAFQSSNMTLREHGSLWYVADEYDKLMWHSKMAFRGWKPRSCSCERSHGWVLVGSHNWSKSSWGTQEGNASLWELSVLCVSTCDTLSSLDMSSVPLPFSPHSVRPFSWKDPMKAGGLGQEECITEILRVAKDRDDDKAEEVLLIPILRTKFSFLHPSANPCALMRRYVWNRTGCAFPPKPGTVIHARVSRSGVEKGKVVWVERVELPYHPVKDDKVPIMDNKQTRSALSSYEGSAHPSSPPAYVPPHMRRRQPTKWTFHYWISEMKSSNWVAWFSECTGWQNNNITKYMPSNHPCFHRMLPPSAPFTAQSAF